MASNNGYLTHCRICGTPIFSLGNRQFCSACYAQNRRNAAHRSNAEAKMRREQAKREEEKMKASNKTVTSAQELAMRAKLSEMGGISYGELSLWEMSHGLEFSAWEHEWEKLNGGTNSDGTKFPDHLPERVPEAPCSAGASLGPFGCLPWLITGKSINGLRITETGIS